jgi:hypothetical protein
MVLVMPVDGSGAGRLAAWNAIGLIRCSCRGLQLDSSASFALQSGFPRGETVFLSHACRGLSK